MHTFKLHFITAIISLSPWPLSLQCIMTNLFSDKWPAVSVIQNSLTLPLTQLSKELWGSRAGNVGRVVCLQAGSYRPLRRKGTG